MGRGGPNGGGTLVRTERTHCMPYWSKEKPFVEQGKLTNRVPLRGKKKRGTTSTLGGKGNRKTDERHEGRNAKRNSNQKHNPTESMTWAKVRGYTPRLRDARNATLLRLGPASL